MLEAAETKTEWGEIVWGMVPWPCTGRTELAPVTITQPMFAMAWSRPAAHVPPVRPAAPYHRRNAVSRTHALCGISQGMQLRHQH